jgi:hypothetical protein
MFVPLHLRRTEDPPTQAKISRPTPSVNMSFHPSHGSCCLHLIQPVQEDDEDWLSGDDGLEAINRDKNFSGGCESLSASLPGMMNNEQ